MGQITKSLMSHCQSVCKHSYGRNIDSILMKFCTLIRGLKSKIEFVWDKNLTTSSIILHRFLKKKFALQPMGTSKRYNSVPVKDNCAQCLFTPYFRRRAILGCYLNFSPPDPCCHGNKFWDKIDYNSAPMKDRKSTPGSRMVT